MFWRCVWVFIVLVSEYWWMFPGRKPTRFSVRPHIEEAFLYWFLSTGECSQGANPPGSQYVHILRKLFYIDFWVLVNVPRAQTHQVLSASTYGGSFSKLISEYWWRIPGLKPTELPGASLWCRYGKASRWGFSGYNTESLTVDHSNVFGELLRFSEYIV
jgi:hypothetical protein